MPNKNYINGRRKEYAAVNFLKSKGFIAFRSAGSHSPIDVIGIHPEKKVILALQLKPESLSKKAGKAIIKEMEQLKLRVYLVNFELIQDLSQLAKLFPNDKTRPVAAAGSGLQN